MPPYAYPTSKTGTAQDLMNVVMRAAEIQLQGAVHSLPHKNSTHRVCLEAPFVFLGRGLSCLARMAPAQPMLRAQDWMFRRLASPHHYPFDESSPVLAGAAALVRNLTKELGREPALIALISHPPVMGEMAHLNFELVRHAARALRRLRGRDCRPKLVVAIDSFALDTIPIHEEGFYAGFMGTYHMGLDRLALERKGLSGWLLRRTAWHRMPWRLAACLNGGGEVGLVLSGGIPATGRILYTVREWIGRQRALSPWRSRPMELLGRLRAYPDFSRFENNGPRAAGLRSVWRLMEGWLMSAAAGVSGSPGGAGGAEAGSLSREARGSFLLGLEALELSSDQIDQAMAALDEELARQTPYRERFFKMLALRLLARGRPVVFVPIAHQVLESGFGIEIKPAWAWRKYNQGIMDALKLSAGGREPLAWRTGPGEFAADFVKGNFS